MKIIIPASERRHMLQRLAFSLSIGAAIAFALATTTERSGYLGAQVILSVAIAAFAWLFVDLGDFVLFSHSIERFPFSKKRHIYLVFAVIAAQFLGEILVYPFLDFGQVRTQFKGFWTWCLITIVMISVFIWAVTQNKFRTEDKRRESDIRLKLLETQLEPHMLFNTLANLRALINTDPVQATKMLDHSVSFLRATVNGSRVSLHTLGTEFERLGDYLDLMKIRMGSRLKYTLDLPPELDGHLIPPFLLQPLVENAIKHGLEPKVEGGRIIVSARADEKQILIEVNDTGVGSDVEYIKESNGFGLKQVTERLLAVYGELGKMTLSNTGDFNTSVQIQFPITQRTEAFA